MFATIFDSESPIHRLSKFICCTIYVHFVAVAEKGGGKSPWTGF